MRKHKYLAIIATMLLSCVLLASCEANPYESTYQREKQAGKVVDRADDYSVEVYGSDIFADQPTTADEFNRLGLVAHGETLTTTSSEIRSVCRERILGFAHAWMQFGYTYSKQSDFDRALEYLTEDLSHSFTQAQLTEQKFTDIQLGKAISDIGSVNFYDRYCRFYTAEDGTEIIRIKSEIIVRISGNEEYFVENQNINQGNVCYEFYFYFENTESMPIYGIYEITSPKKGICWYTDREIVNDDRELRSDEFSHLTGEYKFLKSNVSLPTREKNIVCQRISDFIGAFFNANRKNSDILTNGAVDNDVMETHREFRKAIEKGEIVYDHNYTSYSMEMALPDICLYEDDSKTYYVVKESLMLNTMEGTASEFGLNSIETGLWKYTVYFVFQADDCDFSIVRLEIQPDSGPYESVGDLDEG